MPLNQDIGDMTDFYEQLDLNDFNASAPRAAEPPAAAESGRSARKKERKAKERASKKASKTRSVTPSIPTIGRALSKPTKAASKADLPVIGRAQPRKKEAGNGSEAKGRSKAHDTGQGKDADGKAAQGERSAAEDSKGEASADAWAQSKTAETVSKAAHAGTRKILPAGGRDEGSGKAGQSEPARKMPVPKPTGSPPAAVAKSSNGSTPRNENAWAASSSATSALKASKGAKAPKATRESADPATPVAAESPQESSSSTARGEGDSEQRCVPPKAAATSPEKSPGGPLTSGPRGRSAFTSPAPSRRSGTQPKNGDRVRGLAELLESSFQWITQQQNGAAPSKREQGDTFFSPQNVMLQEDKIPRDFPLEAAPNLLRNLDSGFYRRLSTDTLFFIFYQHQGSFQQYAAAQELHGQGWSFHMRVRTSCRRHSGIADFSAGANEVVPSICPLLLTCVA
eukprot:scaffold2646_cov226-Pinguiococcus_pyrenoidosus.AAC.3